MNFLRSIVALAQEDDRGDYATSLTVACAAGSRGSFEMSRHNSMSTTLADAPS
jgi:hypothetical protein